jgi:glycosyltransferase involved in cell wall biosynthesis
MPESDPAPSPHGPKVSVVLPVWNAERYLAGAIESVLAQTFTDFELLIVDDGSTDGSAALIRRYRDRRIRRIENEKNLGVTRSLNLGLELARGRYVARMDADDLCAPERLERQVAFLDAHPGVALVASRARWVDALGAEIGVIDTPADGETLRRRLRRGNWIVHGTVMMRAEAVRALGGYNESMERAEDYDLWLRLSERHQIAALPALLYTWRDHGGSVSRRHLEQQSQIAERAQLAARRRWASALASAVVAGRVSAARGARRVLELVWEEETALPVTNRRAALAAACARRAPRVHASWYSLRNLSTLVRLRRILAACAAGRQDPGATCAALLACIGELDPAQRSA